MAEDIQYKNDYRIIVVDDSEYSRNAMVTALENNDFNVASAVKSAEEAIQKADGKINLFIIDVVMPKTNGIELAKLVSDKFSDADMIMVSSLKYEQVMIECISAGAKDFLRKPFDDNDLISSVDKLAYQKFTDE